VKPRPFFDLPTGHVHTWRLDLEKPRSPAAALSEAEHAKAASFRKPEDRDRYTLAHGLLRAVLAGYAGCPPEALAFTQRCMACGSTAHGRPEVAQPVAARDLRFSLSHAGARVLLAVARGLEVGLDVEKVTGAPDLDPAFFAPGEREVLAKLEGPARDAAFFTLWTRKEAYLKAVGHGLTEAMGQVDVARDHEAPKATFDPGGPGGGKGWTFRSLDAGKGYAAALAVPGEGLEPWQREWPF
jgi:4'-phosphopantetheinyl transferase